MIEAAVHAGIGLLTGVWGGEGHSVRHSKIQKEHPELNLNGVGYIIVRGVFGGLIIGVGYSSIQSGAELLFDTTLESDFFEAIPQFGLAYAVTYIVFALLTRPNTRS
jgi:hypothetical protein